MNRAEVRRRQAEQLSNMVTIITIVLLGHSLGSNGITYMTAAVTAYALLLTVVSGHAADSLGRLLRSRKNKGQYKNMEKLYKTSMTFQILLGLAGSLTLCISAGGIADGLFGLGCSRIIIMVLSPAVFLRAVSAVLMGCFQGDGSEIPTAAAGILRSLFILGFSVLFSGILGNYGDKAGALLRQENFAAMYRGTGAALAVSLSEVFVILFLALIYKAGGFSKKKNRQEGMYSTDSSFECVRYLWSGRWVQMLTAFLGILPLGTGLFFYVGRAEDSAAVINDYSLYSGCYLVFCIGAVCLISILTMSVFSKIFMSFRKGEHRFGRTAFQGGMHICVVHGIFLAVFAAMMGEQIGELLWPEGTEALLPMLQGGSALIAAAAPAVYFSRFLLTSGRKYQVLTAALLGNVLFTAMTVITAKAGILCLVYGSVAGTFGFCVTLGVFACGQLRLRINWLSLLAMPLGAGVGAGLVCLLIDRFLSPHMHPLVTLTAAFVLAAAVYWAVLVLLRSFKEQELEVVPGGKFINAMRQMLHIY